MMRNRTSVMGTVGDTALVAIMLFISVLCQGGRKAIICTVHKIMIFHGCATTLSSERDIGKYA